MKESLDKKDIELLVKELGEYGKTLGTIEEVSMAIFDIVNLSVIDKGNNVNHEKWVQNLVETERFPGIDKLINDNVFSHQVRLHEMIKELDFFFMFINNNKEQFNLEKKIDLKYCRNFALLHDDVEGINPLKDIPTDIKMNLSEKANKILSYIENKCVNILCSYQKDHLSIISSQELRKIYIDAEIKNTIEGELMSYLDKVDGFNSCLHELHAGNIQFIKPLKNYIEIFKNIKNNKSKYSKIRFLLDSDMKILREVLELGFGFKIEDFVGKNITPIEYMIYTHMIKNFNSLDFFNIDFILSTEDYLDNILKKGIEKGLEDKKVEYKQLVINDNNGILSMRPIPDVKTTMFTFYEAWKIAYAKIGYDKGEGNIVYGFDIMYGNKK